MLDALLAASLSCEDPVAVEAWCPAVLRASSLRAGPWPLPLGTVNDINHKTLVNSKPLGEPTSLHQPTRGVNTNRPGGAHRGGHLSCPRDATSPVPASQASSRDQGDRAGGEQGLSFQGDLPPLCHHEVFRERDHPQRDKASLKGGGGPSSTPSLMPTPSAPRASRDTPASGQESL